MSAPYRIFIGWDSRETEAYDVASYSLRRRASSPVEIVPIRQDELRRANLYWRGEDRLATTEFTYTRFLTPSLAGWSGRVLYCDCDFLWLGDVVDLFALTAGGGMAVWCVQHHHRPREIMKMEGAIQSIYPRKNWSSLMLFDCEHPSVQNLTLDVVNNKTGAYLHRMQWVADDDIGALPFEWNWLEGWNKKPPSGLPKAVHFTRGGPWFKKWRNTEYADLWLAERRAMEEATGY
jgi:lipopolysaccharide biosynthesis glycosyltransferase